jgi:hypothetical protein
MTPIRVTYTIICHNTYLVTGVTKTTFDELTYWGTYSTKQLAEKAIKSLRLRARYNEVTVNKEGVNTGMGQYIEQYRYNNIGECYEVRKWN